jgi:hypothetical protein
MTAANYSRFPNASNEDGPISIGRVRGDGLMHRPTIYGIC